jgi:hypothetical protein
MAKQVALSLSEEEAKFVLQALDRAPFQGIAAARLITAIAEKISVASRFAGERAPLEQAILARVDGGKP